MTAASESGYPSRMSTGSCRERHSDLASAKGAVLFNLSWSFRAMERIRFIAHEGNQILFVDFSNCSADEVQTIARTVPDYVTTKPRGSVLLSRYIAQGRAGRKSGTSSAGPRGTGPAEGRFCAEEAPR